MNRNYPTTLLRVSHFEDPAQPGPKCVLLRPRSSRALTALLLAIAALSGCATQNPVPCPSFAGPALTVTFTAPLSARIGELQQALAEGRQPWRNDPFLVARAEFLGLLAAPPAALDEEQLALLKSIDRARVENNSGYEMHYDAAKQMHITFPAPPFAVEATLDRATGRHDLPAVWITRGVVLTHLPRNR